MLPAFLRKVPIVPMRNGGACVCICNSNWEVVGVSSLLVYWSIRCLIIIVRLGFKIRKVPCMIIQRSEHFGYGYRPAEGGWSERSERKGNLTKM